MLTFVIELSHRAPTIQKLTLRVYRAINFDCTSLYGTHMQYKTIHVCCYMTFCPTLLPNQITNGLLIATNPGYEGDILKTNLPTITLFSLFLFGCGGGSDSATTPPKKKHSNTIELKQAPGVYLTAKSDANTLVNDKYYGVSFIYDDSDNAAFRTIAGGTMSTTSEHNTQLTSLIRTRADVNKGQANCDTLKVDSMSPTQLASFDIKGPMVRARFTTITESDKAEFLARTFQGLRAADSTGFKLRLTEHSSENQLFMPIKALRPSQINTGYLGDWEYDNNHSMGNGQTIIYDRYTFSHNSSNELILVAKMNGMSSCDVNFTNMEYDHAIRTFKFKGTIQGINQCKIELGKSKLYDNLLTDSHTLLLAFAENDNRDQIKMLLNHHSVGTSKALNLSGNGIYIKN